MWEKIQCFPFSSVDISSLLLISIVLGDGLSFRILFVGREIGSEGLVWIGNVKIREDCVG